MYAVTVIKNIRETLTSHQPLIMKQSADNISTSTTSSNNNKNTTHSLENTPAVLNNETDWHNILKNDLCLSSSEEDIPSKISKGTITDTITKSRQKHGSKHFPLCIADMWDTNHLLLNTHIKMNPCQNETIFKDL